MKTFPSNWQSRAKIFRERRVPRTNTEEEAASDGKFIEEIFTGLKLCAWRLLRSSSTLCLFWLSRDHATRLGTMQGTGTTADNWRTLNFTRKRTRRCARRRQSTDSLCASVFAQSQTTALNLSINRRELKCMWACPMRGERAGVDVEFRNARPHFSITVVTNCKTRSIWAYQPRWFGEGKCGGKKKKKIGSGEQAVGGESELSEERAQQQQKIEFQWLEVNSIIKKSSNHWQHHTSGFEPHFFLNLFITNYLLNQTSQPPPSFQPR